MRLHPPFKFIKMKTIMFVVVYKVDTLLKSCLTKKKSFFLVLTETFLEIYTCCNEICRQTMLDEVCTNNGRRKCNLKVFLLQWLDKMFEKNC